MHVHTESSTLIQERSDALLAMYQEHRVHARHHESQRARVSYLIIISTLGLVTVISADGLKRADWPLTASLILIGLFGTLFLASQFERIRLYKHRSDEYRKALDLLLFEEVAGEGRGTGTLGSIAEYADEEHRKQFPRMRGLTGFKPFWICWPLTIALIGAWATVHALCVLDDPGPAAATSPAGKKEVVR